MKYVQPYGISDPNAGYINGNPATGTMGSIPPAASIEHPQREIANFITDANAFAPSAVDLHQMSKSVQSGKVNYALDIGSAVNAIIIPLSPVPDAYYAGMQIRFKAKFAPTGATTIDAGRGARPLAKSGGGAIIGGEWSVGDIIEATYDGALNRWQLPVSPYASLYAPKDYYVNSTTGSDGNDGLTAGTAFATLQRAQNATYIYNLNGFPINIHVAHGNYGPVTCGLINGSGSINYIGDPITPAAVVVANNAGSAMAFQGKGYTVDGFRVSSTGRGPYVGTTGNGIWAPGGAVTVYAVDFSNCIDYQCVADAAGMISYIGPISISGNAAAHIVSTNNSFIRQGGPPTYCAIPGPVTFSAFIWATGGGSIYVLYSPSIVNAPVTGARFSANANGVIGVDGANANGVYPGSTNGALTTGGQVF